MQEEHVLIEEQFINILLNEKEMVRHWLTTPYGLKYFSSDHQVILKGIIWAYNEGVQLTRQSYKMFAEQMTRSGAEAVAELAVYNRILMRFTKKDDFPMLLKRIRQSFINRKTTECFQEYEKNRKQKGSEEANRILAQKLQSLDADTIESNTAFIDLAENKAEFMADLLERKNNPAKRLTCGISEIDDTMSVGFIEGGLTIFCAAPGSYKTTIMMNVGLNIFQQHNENVLFLPLEMPYKMMMQKIISRETRIPFEKIAKPDGGGDISRQLTDAEIRQIEMEFDKWEGVNSRFKVLKIGDRAKVSTIRAEIDKRISYFKPRVVIIDYIDNVVPESSQARNDLQLRDMFEDMIKMGDYYGFHVVTAAKLSRDALKRVRDQSENKQELDSTDIHGGQEFGGNATNIYGQLRSKNNPGKQLDFFCMKSRYGKNVFSGNRTKTNLNIDPECGRIESGEQNGLADAWAAAGKLGDLGAAMDAPPQQEEQPW